MSADPSQHCNSNYTFPRLWRYYQQFIGPTHAFSSSVYFFLPCSARIGRSPTKIKRLNLSKLKTYVAAMIGAAKAFLFNLAKFTQLFDIFLIWSLYLKWLLKCIRSIDLPLKEILSCHFGFNLIWFWCFLYDDFFDLFV